MSTELKLSNIQIGLKKMVPPSVAVIWFGGTLVLWCLYLGVFMGAIGQPLLAAAIDASGNVLPLAVLAAATYNLIKKHVMCWPVLLQIAAHFILSVIFAITWYFLIVTFLGVASGLQGRGLIFRGFNAVGFSWQTFQGMIFYATIAATSYAVRGGRGASEVHIVSQGPFERYLVRLGDEIVPIKVSEVAVITGAQDYAEVTTAQGKKHLVRMSLSEFGYRLDPHRFLRVHRPTIINLDHMIRAEPAGGGRLLLHMKAGLAIQASRSGAQSLRALVV